MQVLPQSSLGELVELKELAELWFPGKTSVSVECTCAELTHLSGMQT